MRFRHSLLAVLPLLAVFVLAGQGRADESAALTMAQYRQWLQDKQAQVAALPVAPQKAQAIRDGISESLTVETASGRLTVQTNSLRDSLDKFLTADAKSKPKIVSDLSNHLQALRAEADLYEQPGRADVATRQRLDQILSASEFNHIRGPSSLELFKQKAQAWVMKWLRKIDPSIPDIQDAGQWFVWIMMCLATVACAIWLYRLSLQTMNDGQREVIPFMISSRPWSEWLADARASAARGEWRDAIHFGFWAAVSRLESDGVWPADKTRTPREYLNAIPVSNVAKEPFGILTRKFEASWYGSRPTTEADFAQFTDNLERLGCR